jgi:ceramide glucosyltransferase
VAGGALVWLGAGWWAASSTLHWATAALARKPRHIVPAAASRGAIDFSVVAPLNGANDASATYIAALRELSQAGAEILICVASDGDGAIAPLRAQWPDAPLLVGSDLTFNPKMNNVRKGLEAASRDIVVLCDAGIELTSGMLGRAAASLSGGVGLVLALKAAEEPLNFAAELERAYIDGHQARFLFAADRLGMTVASGGVTMMSRETLQRVGNWRGFNRWIADDYSVTRSVRELGLRTRLGEIMPRLPLGRRHWLEVWRRQVRWARTRLRLPVWPLVLWEPTVGWAASGAAGALALAGFGMPWAFVAAAAFVHTLAWLAGEKWFMSGRQLAFGPRAALAALVRESLAPVLMLSALSGRSILWRGTDLGGRWRRESAGKHGAPAGGDGTSGSTV